MNTTPAPALSADLAQRPPSKSWPADASDVFVRESGCIGPRLWHYTVEVDGKMHDQFTSSGTPLTWSQMVDVQQGYLAGINGS